MSIANFTIPEAEAARKAVAKKWVDKLAPIEEKWKKGASERLGPEMAADWWEKMLTLIEKMVSEIPCYTLQFDKSGKVVDMLEEKLLNVEH